MVVDKKILAEEFPFLNEGQLEKLNDFSSFLLEWNEKVNLISRKDSVHFFEHHLLHVLSICKFIRFNPGSKVLDLGTGGGLPGIPLAICFPDSKFHLIDARSKKINCLKDIIEKLGLENANAEHIRAEYVKQKYDFVVSRAVGKLERLWEWSKPLIHLKQNNSFPNGLVCYKGGDLKAEIKSLKADQDATECIAIKDLLDGEWFNDKFLIYIQK